MQTSSVPIRTFLEKKMQKKSFTFRNRSLAAMTVALASLGFSACTTTPPASNDSPRVDRHEIDANVDGTLSRLYATVPSSRELVRRAKGVVVFPTVLQAGFGIGAEYGKGELRVDNAPESYYRLTAGSVGFQIGAQSKAVVILFMTQDSLEKFRHSNGWEVGADATVAIANIGANGDIDTDTYQKPVVGFVTTNAGVMAGVSLQGAKIGRISP
jgi:lipid-binding SYLF domain-containing protein